MFLPTKLHGIDSSILIDKMVLDKKNRGDNIVFILPTGTGKVDSFSDIDINMLNSVLQD